MQLSPEHINDFIELYRSKYGVSLEPQEALQMATKIARLVEVVEHEYYKEKVIVF